MHPGPGSERRSAHYRRLPLSQALTVRRAVPAHWDVRLLPDIVAGGRLGKVRAQEPDP